MNICFFCIMLIEKLQIGKINTRRCSHGVETSDGSMMMKYSQYTLELPIFSIYSHSDGSLYNVQIRLGSDSVPSINQICLLWVLQPCIIIRPILCTEMGLGSPIRHCTMCSFKWAINSFSSCAINSYLECIVLIF